MATPKYDQADESVYTMAAEVMEKYHGDRLRLNDKSLPTLAILWAFLDDEKDDRPLKDRGRPVIATISVTSYKHRVDRRRDAEICLDQKAWERMTEGQQRALLDHCITALDVSVDDHGFLATDDAGRPKFKIKPFDFVVQGFAQVARRHGADAPECIAAAAFAADFGADVLVSDKLFV